MGTIQKGFEETEKRFKEIKEATEKIIVAMNEISLTTEKAMSILEQLRNTSSDIVRSDNKKKRKRIIKNKIKEKT